MPPREETTLKFREGTLKVDAFIRREREEPVRPPRPADLDIDVAEEREWIPLAEKHTKDMESLLAFLREQARIGDKAFVWCYRAVWIRLLTVLDHTGSSLPKTVRLPRDE